MRRRPRGGSSKCEASRPKTLIQQRTVAFTFYWTILAFDSTWDGCSVLFASRSCCRARADVFVYRYLFLLGWAPLVAGVAPASSSTVGLLTTESVVYADIPHFGVSHRVRVLLRLKVKPSGFSQSYSLCHGSDFLMCGIQTALA